ncbi:MAG TPA: SDR family oxidoreductase [Longimicrobiaceae bacterium]|nr:SDR family oxidoreductase [Longimicrobiaceae bacterium]
MADDEVRMDGRVCVVTGASAGIGRATALGLARMGARVAMVARSRERGEAARAAVARESGSDAVELFLADLSSQGEVRRLAAELRERFGRLDVLVNNAAVYARERTLTVDGIELQLAVNHLAPFLLTNQLLDLLERSAPARVVTVSSEAHRAVPLEWDNLQGERRYRGLRAYCTAKLANLLFTRELARRLEGTRVTANAAHPGVVGTELLFGGWGPLRLLRGFLRTPEEGARVVLHLAASPEVEGVTGRYFRDAREIRPSAAALDDGNARRLWRVSEELTGLAAS